MLNTEVKVPCENPVLSILICSMPEREQKLNALLTFLASRSRNLPVEIIVFNSPRGGFTTGYKRNVLLSESKGKYVAFIDDDDMVSDNYVSKILEAAKNDSDCIGIVGIYRKRGRSDWTFRHSITVTKWCKDSANCIYYRTPNHLNPIKREFAIKAGFPEITVGEDRSYSDRVRPMLKTETFIEDRIYFYFDGK
jgi:GT2 family glycosyltransferase